MKMLLLMVFIIFIYAELPSSLSYENASDAKKLVINNKYETDEIFQENKNEGENIVLNCEFSPGNDRNEMISLEWYHNSTPITETQYSARAYVMNTTKVKDNKKILRLTMRRLNSKYDAGLYECIVKYKDMDQALKRRVNLNVIKPAYWANTDKVASATLGEKLDINCGAHGTPKPTVDILLSNGSQLPEDFIVRNGDDAGDNENLISIKSISMGHRGIEVQCMASQVLDDVDDNPVVVKIVTIDVLYAPSFEDGNEVQRYGLLSSNYTITCQVKDSNPPVSSFAFYEYSKNPDNNEPTREEIKGGYKDYKVESVLETQTATLFIPKLNETHFDDFKYECLAINKHNLENTQKIELLKILTLAAPHVTDVTESEGNDDSSVVWKIENFEKFPPYSPVIKYLYKYVGEDEVNTTDWDALTPKEILKRDDNLYTITGVKQNTRYVFKFAAVNAAGDGDYTTLPCDRCLAEPRSGPKSGTNGIWFPWNSFYSWTFTVVISCFTTSLYV